MKINKFITPLRSVRFDSPEDHCGYYGVIIKPNWMPSVFAYLVRDFLPIRIGWLNRNSSDEWFVYDGPNGESFYEDGTHANSTKVKPFLWCPRKTHYNVKVTFHGGSMWNSSSEPTNEFRISK
jgi:hypothetical protein